MGIDSEYQNAFEQMDEIIEFRRHNKLYTAMGYTSNLDVLCSFEVNKLNKLLEEYVPDEKLEDMKIPSLITSMEEFLHAVVSYCMQGAGGEVDILDFKIIDRAFDTGLGMGGTATQAAMALAAVKCPSVIHLTDDSKEVCDILNSPYIYTVSEEEKLIHTDKIRAKAEQEIHYIIQFKKGDVIKLKDQEVLIPASNRMIVTKITVNETVPFSKPYFHYIENNAENIKSNVISSFNAVQQREVLGERLDYVKEHCGKYKKNNKKGILYFEDAHYHNIDVRRMCLETIYPHVDVVSLNEEELSYTLNMYQKPVDIDNILQCIEGIRFIIDFFHIQKGMIVHTKDYSMYVGKELDCDIKKGLMYGNLLATAKALYGWYGTREQIEKVLELPLNEKGIRNLEKIRKNGIEDAIIVPTKYIDKPQYTIGLGDSFVAGVQICFS